MQKVVSLGVLYLIFAILDAIFRVMEVHTFLTVHNGICFTNEAFYFIIILFVA